MEAIPPLPRPRLRGVVHQWSFFVALIAGATLVALAPAGRATAASAIYAVALAGLLGTSAALPPRHLAAAAPGAWMRRLDHSMIFVLIAGTYTPFALLVLDEPAARGRADRRLERRAGRDRVHDDLGRRAEVAHRDHLRRAGLVLDHRRAPDHRARRRRGAGPARPSAGWPTRPGRSSTRAAGPIRGRPRSATTRSSTCSSWSPPPRISRQLRLLRYPTAVEHVAVRTKFPLKPGTRFVTMAAAPFAAVGQSKPGATTSEVLLSMPVAFKEWAITVRALAEGEQLLTLRKGGIREENKHFEIEHDRFFLYPTFDHQRNDCVRERTCPSSGAPSRRASGPTTSRPPRRSSRTAASRSPTGCGSARGPRWRPAT